MSRRNKKNSIALVIAYLTAAIVICMLITPLDARAQDGDARQLSPSLSAGNGANVNALTDENYDTKAEFSPGDVLTVRTSEEIGGIYLKWAKPPAPWFLRYGDSFETTCGTEGFLHEYVPVADSGINECSICFDANVALCDVYVYSKGNVPKNVQQWNKSCEHADFLVFSTHADDECIFLGGVLAKYAGEGLRCQVVYLTNYWDALVIREHEKLDGLWTMGVKYYPVTGDFGDQWAEDLEGAEKVYNREDVTVFLTEQIRKFKPQVVVTQDFDGEYGHGAHILFAHCVKEALDHSAESGYCPDSVQFYGTWDVPKAYFHFYDENRIRLDLHQPIPSLGGMTALEAAAEGYKQHVSQQWCWFYITDDPEDEKADKLNCAEFGCYKSSVGADTANDMFEHLTAYEVLEREELKLKEEEEKRLAEEAEAAEKARLKAERLKALEAAEEEEHKLTPAGIFTLLLMLALLTAGVVVYMKKPAPVRAKKRSSRRYRD